MQSCEWYFSYYAINNFLDCKVYLAIARKSGQNKYMFDTDLFLWQPHFTKNRVNSLVESSKSIDGLMFALVIAEKGQQSTIDQIPIQLHYMGETANWSRKYEEYSLGYRPLLKPDKQKSNVALPYGSDHYIYLGSDF